MEMRRLLAGDIGSIAGNLYVDLTDDGFDVADTAAVGATVYLYRDGGNATFDSSGGTAGGDDVLIGTDVSDANGDYSFERLTAGTYYVEQAPATGLLQRATENPKTVVLSEADAAGILATNIDTYDSTVQTVVAAQGATATDTSATAANETLGDERDILVSNTGLPGAGNLEAETSSSVLIINTDSGAQGSVIVTYDGIDADATTIDHTNLNIDLTAGGGTAFHFLATSQAGNQLQVNVYSSAVDYSSLTVNLPVTGSLLTYENLLMHFSDFVADPGGSGADFTSVTAIRMEVLVAESVDARIDFSQVVAPFVSTQNFQNLNPMSVGNQVFNDDNNNGIFDSGETGIAGVTVELYEDTNANGSFDTGVDTLVDTTVTDTAGQYVFGDLFPGEYIAVVPISQFATAADPLFGFLSSSGNDPAPDPDIDVSDNDDNGTLIAGVGVATAAISLAAGQEPTNDGDTDTNSNLTLDFGFTPQVDLVITKTADAATKIAGNQVTYTLTVSNQGDATANNVLVVDDLPDFMTIDSVTASGGGVVTQTGSTAGEIEIAYTSLTPTQSETITIVATIPADQAAAAAVTNTATVSSGGVETDATNNTDSADIEITRQAVLGLTKTDTPDPSTVGSQLTYEIIVTNSGPSTATNVVVTDTLPAGLTFDSVTSTAGTAGEASGVITVNIPTLAVGGSATITVVSTIQSTFTGTTIANTASAQADEAAQVTANANTTVNPSVDLQITKSDDVDPVNRGGTLVYTLVVTNNGPSEATSVEVVDTLPSDVTFVSATGGTVTPPSGGSSDVLVALGSLASGASQTVTITVDVSQTAANSFTNNAIVRSSESTAGFDSNTANNSVSESTATQGTVDLAITKTDSADPVIPGQAFSYTIVVTNNGPSNAGGVTVVDNLPDGIQITSATSTVGTVTIPSSAQDTTAANNDDLTVDIGSLLSGATATITVNATVLAATRGTLTNVATVSTSDTSLIDSDSTNNSVTETTTLSPEIDLRITKADSVDPAIAGNSLVYTMVVTNDGPSTATNVNVSDTLPAGVTFTNVTSTQGTASQASGIVTAALGTLEPGASATITLTVGISAATRGTVTNTATVTGAESDSDSTNNSATATTTVNGNVDLSITKVDSQDPVAAGGSLTYTIMVTNTGPSTATSVVVTDSLPADLTFVSGTSTVGTVTNTGNAVTASVGTLASGASATITINANVASTTTANLSNTATVTSAETDTNTANNSATQTTAIAVPGSIAGTVYTDANRNGTRDTGEAGISGVTITLTGTDIMGGTVNRTTTTDSSGNYLFDNLLPGTYTLTETQPEGLGDGQANVGTGATGTAGTNVIDTITLGSGANAVSFNFGELPAAFSKRRFLASAT